MPYVISTMGQPTDYAFYKRFEDGRGIRNQLERTIHVAGGQGVMEPKALITPENGVVTEISDEEAELLKNHPVFKMHEASGNVRIVSHKLNVERTVEKHMAHDDDSSQLTPEDFADDAAAAENADSELKMNGRKVAAKRGARSRKIK